MFLILIATILVLSYFYVKYTFSHWKRHGIVQKEPSFPFGNVKDLILKKDSFGMMYQSLYNYYKSQNVAVGGYYFTLQPELVLVDTDIIKTVLAKDFAYFSDRGTYIDEKNDPLSGHLFALPGTKWKPLRSKLTPTFTSGKMKMMFSILLACSEEMKTLLDTMAAQDEPVECKDVLSRFTMDVIGSCAFGIDCDSIKNPDNEFRNKSMMVLQVKGLDVLRQMLSITFPKTMSFFGIPGMNPKATGFFYNVVKETVEYREKNNITRNDFLQLLIEMKNKPKTDDNDGLNLIQIAAQCFIFFLAGFETSSITMTFCLFELAANEEIQDKVRKEIATVLKKYNGQITYDAVMEMHYLDKAINETLRKYPPLPFLNREATADYKIPGTDYIARKGTQVVVSLQGLHKDPEYYPDPEKFDPERFSEEEKLNRPHYSYLPFGEGPRICIGLRFGLLQTKVGLVQIINNFKCSINDKTELPIKLTNDAFMTVSDGGIWLNMTKISK